MERVNGIGGVFFKSNEPGTLSAWYAERLGVDTPPQSYGGEVWRQDAGPTVFAPFGPEHADSPYLGPSGWGINFRVDDLDAMVDQLRASGLEVDVDTELYPNGRFAQLQDPEGNAIQLWEPA
jgi:glyoxylase I family protein